jgi:hypothetical protein
MDQEFEVLQYNGERKRFCSTSVVLNDGGVEKHKEANQCSYASWAGLKGIVHEEAVDAILQPLCAHPTVFKSRSTGELFIYRLVIVSESLFDQCQPDAMAAAAMICYGGPVTPMFRSTLRDAAPMAGKITVGDIAMAFLRGAMARIEEAGAVNAARAEKVHAA